MGQQKFVLGARGQKKGVVLSIRRYKQLLEDLHDLAVVAERRNEKPISLEELERRLKKDGFL